MLQFQTRIGEFCLVFQDENTLVFNLPDFATGGFCFRISPIHWRKTEDGGELNHVRNVMYRSNEGRVISNQTHSDEKGLVVEFIVQAEKDCSLIIQITDKAKFPQEVLPFSVIRESAKQRWTNWFNSVPKVNESYRQKYAYAWWVMANNLISPSGYIKYEAMMPTKAFYVGIWLWDSAFHAIAFRHIDPELARNQIRVMLAHQLSNGMLPDVVFDEGIVAEIDHPIHGPVTKPPIFAWSALKIHETEPNIDFLTEIYEPLTRCNAWWFNNNDNDNDGIVQYSHPYSSGLDDSPLWDHGMPIESPDINTYLYIQMDSLARIAKIIGKFEQEDMWRTRANELLERMIENLWDEKTGLFHAKHNEISIPVVTPFHLYPLWTGKLPQEIQKRLLDKLKDPDEFWGKFGLPTVAFTDPAYNPDKMWRGPVWANINYFFIEALQKVGEHQLAEELRHKILDMIASYPDIREYYNSQNGKPPTTAAPIFGWSASVFIDLVLMQKADI